MVKDWIAGTHNDTNLTRGKNMKPLIKDYLKTDVKNMKVGLKAALTSLIEPVKINVKDIVDYITFFAKTMFIVFAIISVIGVVQRAGQDDQDERLQAEAHQEMLDTLP